MSVNFSSIDDLSSSNSSLDLHMNPCFRSEMSIFTFSAFSIMNLLFLPLFVFILYLGYQQWRQQRSISTTATSHSDLYTYHATAMELNEVLALTFIFCGGHIYLPEMMWGGLSLSCITAFGQALFQILTCVEHYLAIVHPITYLHVRQASGVRIRNISIGCVWLLSFGWLAVWSLVSSTSYFILYCCFVAFSLIIVSFCSISVLCALKRPGPGKVGRNKERFDKTKKRAFYTIMAIMGVLLFRIVGNLTSNMINSSVVVNYCVVLMSTVWLDLPSSLVLPLLFLRRIGKLQCCKHKK